MRDRGYRSGLGLCGGTHGRLRVAPGALLARGRAIPPIPAYRGVGLATARARARREHHRDIPLALVSPSLLGVAQVVGALGAAPRAVARAGRPLDGGATEGAR